jgi:GAF domain-containing protein
VVTPEGVDLADGDTVPLSATNCERVLSRGEPVALHDIESQAPELAERAGNLELGVAAYLGVPVVVDGDAVGTFCFYDREPRPEPFTDWEVTFVEHLGQWVAQALEQRRYVEQLHALNEVNEVVHEVADAVIEESTREEIEQQVCASLAATDSYLFAWIGQPNPETEEVELRAEAGVEGYLDDITISVDGSSARARGPTGRALQTDEVQILQEADAAPEYEPWEDVVEEHGFRSSAAIPIVHEGTNYGVLNLYTERPDAFEGEERERVDLLGKMVGHAIAAADRKQALLSDSMVELTLRTSDVLSSLNISEQPSSPVTLEAAVPRREGEYVVFGEAAVEDRGFVEELAEKQPHWSELVNVEEADGRLRFEAVLSDPPLLQALTAAGGQLGKAVVEGGDMRMEIHLPPQAEVRKALDGVRAAYPSTSLVSKQELSARRVSDDQGMRVPLTELTERQRESLRTAYYAGYFEWPRESSGEEVAELLDIAAPTFSQHLRGAERTVFGSLFDEEPT